MMNNVSNGRCSHHYITVILARTCSQYSKLREYEDYYNWSGIKFPTPKEHWTKFERQNDIVALNVLYINGKEVRQAYISRFNSVRQKIADLLIIEKEGKKHYVAIKKLSALLRGITSRNNGDFYCRNCLHSFRTEDAMKIHNEACKDHDFCQVKMPTGEKKWLYYQDGAKAIRVPFVIYGDMECILKPIDGVDSDPEKPYTRDINKHIPCGVAFYTKFAHGEYDRAMKYYRGEDCVQEFCKTLKEQVHRIVRYKKQAMISLTAEEKEEYEDAFLCHICTKPFTRECKKVRDHCHYTGKYRGAAHNKCNLAYRIPSYIPVVFHNLSKYDAHLFIRELAEEFGVEEMECIAENVEKYISFSVPIIVEVLDNEGKPVKLNKNGKEEILKKKCMLRFIDSCRFMQSSLCSLVDNLAGTNTDDVVCVKCKKEMELDNIDINYIAHFKCESCHYKKSKQLDKEVLKSKFQNVYKYCGEDEHFRLMLRKGIYPYEYMDSWDRFEQIELPSKELFYSKLNLSEISELDYKHAEKVWKEFECRDLGDYHDLYLNSDVLLLADIFEAF